MAFLGRSRKEDLRMLATELGLAPSDNLKIIELKDLITNGDRYDEEFVKDILSVIVGELTATEKQKAAELQEKQKAVWLWLSNVKENSNGKKLKFNLKCRSCHKHLLQANS
ncbi:uncharacterized protein TNCV_2427801 [Trichonephila clavipes]|nr:uncharacterized protein TNCV_2427801 [Trichonephila clavipes]